MNEKFPKTVQHRQRKCLTIQLEQSLEEKKFKTVIIENIVALLSVSTLQQQLVLSLLSCFQYFCDPGEEKVSLFFIKGILD